jgi:hypothetical protein
MRIRSGSESVVLPRRQALLLYISIQFGCVMLQSTQRLV